jgi:chemotaxis protein MotB
MRLYTAFVVLSLLGNAGCVGKKKYDAVEAELASERARSATLQTQLDSTTDRASALAKQAEALQTDVQDLEKALAQMRQREDVAKMRVQAYQDLVKRFADLIDSGFLKVEIVEGRMVVQIGTDILFPSGSADLSKAGKDALAKVGSVLAQLPENQYQVEGHTDDVPIKTAKYPSNWALAAARALTVVQALTAAGVKPSQISAASYAEYKPAQPNTTPEGKQANRRIEIVILPDLSILPGFEELNALADTEAQAPAKTP